MISQRSRSYVKANDTTRFLDLKNIDIDPQIINLSALVQTLWSEKSFCKIVANVTHSRTSHVQTTQGIFTLLKGPKITYLVLKFGDNCSSSNRDTAQNVSLQGHDLECQCHS